MGKTYNLSKRASQDLSRDKKTSIELEGFTNGHHRSEYKKSEVQTKPSKKVGFFGLFRFADIKDKLLMFIGTIAALGHGVCIQLNFLILSDTLDLFANATKVVGNETVPDRERLEGSIWYIVGSFSIIGVMVMVCGFLNVMCWCMAAERQVRVIRRLAFTSVLRQHMAWFDTQQSGQINTKLTSDIYNIQAGIGDKIATFIQWSGTFLAGTVICLIRSWELTLAMLAISPLAIIVAGVSAKLLKKAASKESEANSDAGAIAGEVFRNIRTVTAYSGQEKEVSRFMKYLQIVKDVGLRRGLVGGIGQCGFWVIVFATLGFGFWFGAYLYRTTGSPTSGTVMQVIISLVSGTRSLSFAVNNIDYFSMASGGASVIYPLIDAVSEIDSSSEEGKKPKEVEGNIKFENITFSYPTNMIHKVLDGFSLELKKGKTMALVGSSGCGKSTIVQCIQRFYDPTQGKITLDGVDLKDLNTKWLRQQIGIVSQEPLLFATSIKENIMMGRENVTFEEVEQAAKDANAHNFILGFPDKYDTLVGSKGGQMSGGQKQRIAIARALVRNPRILILDDATSALDYQSESIVQDALNRAREGRTMLIVAHRLSTIRNADSICVVDQGKVVETGTHDELVAQGGIYANLISGQTHDDSEEEGDDENEEYVAKTLSASPIVTEFNRQLSEDSSRRSSRSLASSRGSGRRRRTRTSSEPKKELEKVVEEEEPEPAPLGRILKLNAPEIPLIVIGCLGAAVQGGLFPSLAFVLAEILAVFNKPPDEQEQMINIYVMILAIAGVVAGIATFLMIFMFTISGEKLTLRLRDAAFRAMIRQEMGWYDEDRNQVGSLTSRLASDAAMVKAATGAHLSTLVNSFSTLCLSLIMALVFDWKLTLVCLAFIPLLIATGVIQSTFLLGFAKGSKKSMEEGGKIVSEAIDNVKTVASLTKEDYFFQKYDSHFDVAFKEGKKRSFIYGLSWGLAQSVFFYAYAANYGYGAYLIGTGGTKFEDVFRVFIAISSGAVELGRINAFAADYTKAKISASKLFALFERKSKIDPTDNSGTTPDSFSGRVAFTKVAFRYPTRPEAQVLTNLNLSVSPGQTLALVGASGCGKSTSVSMLERFYDPERGSVNVDGVNINKLNITWLRSHMGIVAQEPMLFETTIKANIAYGDHTREIPMEEIIAAARQANIHEFVTSLPQGYETELGAKGVQLVGGQKQRIAIARALVRDPKILLLDEATSALDTENEKVVQEALDKAQKGRTCIVIAHRLSTIEHADIIAVIDQGVVAESGRHADLMELKGLYYMLQMIQSGANRDKS